MKKFLLVLLVLVIIAGAFAAGLFVKASHDFQGLVDFTKEAQEDYQQLSGKIEWEQPATGAVVEDERWSRFRQIREEVVREIPPGLNAQVTRILNSPDPGLIAQASIVLNMQPLLERPIRAHVAALERHQMNPVEYRFLTGVAMNGAVGQPEVYPAGRAYRELFGRLVGFARAFTERARLDVEPDMIPPPEFVVETLEEEYGEYPEAPAEVLASLQSSDPAAYLFDIFIVAVEPEDLAAAESMAADGGAAAGVGAAQ